MRIPHQVRQRVEYLLAYCLLKLLGFIPRSWALWIGAVIGHFAYQSLGRLRQVGLRNLELAFPKQNLPEREQILKGAFRHLGRLLAEFSQFPKLDPTSITRIVEYNGLEHYQQASASGRGVLILTAHFGAWELSSFAHSLYGYPMHVLARRLDNPWLDRLIEQYRTLSGNQVIDKRAAARKVLKALKHGETVGILLDLNTQPHEGIFCDFFGLPACTSPIIAALALRTGACVVPGFLIWEEALQKHRLQFNPLVELEVTGDFQRDIEVNTTKLNRIIETMIRNHPDQWIWIHKRWHTRPGGETDLYKA